VLDVAESLTRQILVGSQKQRSLAICLDENLVIVNARCELGYIDYIVTNGENKRLEMLVGRRSTAWNRL
jgi:hypothetical protein